MPYAPNIDGYKPFYIQTDSVAHDTATRWGMIVKSSPYPVFPDPKPRYSVDWKDEDGVAEYGTTQALASLEFSVEFVILARDVPYLRAATQIRKQFGNFAAEVRGGYISIYDSYTGVGLRKVRLVGFTEGDYWQGGRRCGSVFSVQFACDDPTTRMKLSSGAISVDTSQPTLPSPYSPPVEDYMPFYLQGKTENAAKDTKTEWGMVAKTEPAPAIPAPKAQELSDIPFENGKGGFVQTFFAPREFSVSFYLKTYATQTLTADYILLSRLLAFRTYLTSNRLLAYDSWADVGYDDVQYEGGSVDDYVAGDDFARAIFTVRFRTNAPTSVVVYENGSLVVQGYKALRDVDSVPLRDTDDKQLMALADND